VISFQLFDRIRRAMRMVQTKNHKLDILQALNEEIGEYVLACRVEANTKLGNPRILRESSAVEAIDIMLVALEAYIEAGGDFDELHLIVERKLSKWENNLLEQRPMPSNGHLQKEPSS